MYEKKVYIPVTKMAAVRGHRSSFFVLSLPLVEARICFAAHGSRGFLSSLGPSSSPSTSLSPPFSSSLRGRGRTSRLSLLHLFIGPLYYLQFGARSREGNFILVFCLLPYCHTHLLLHLLFPYFLASFFLFFFFSCSSETSYEVMLPRTRGYFDWRNDRGKREEIVLYTLYYRGRTYWVIERPWGVVLQEMWKAKCFCVLCKWGCKVL